MKFKFLMVFSGLFFLIQVFSQTSNHEKHEKDPDKMDQHAVLFSMDYASNTNVLGNISEETRQPSFSPSLILFSRWSADLSLIGNFIGNSDDSLEHFTSELDLMLGYTFSPHRNLTIYPSYTHYFYSSNSNALKSLFSDDIRLDIDYNYQFINLGISGGYYLGKMNTFYATAFNSYRINFGRFLFRNASLNLQPGIDANFGSYEYLNLYFVDQLRDNSSLYSYLLSYPAIRRYAYSEKVKHPVLTLREILDNYLEEKAQDSFKLTSVGINLPVYFTIGNFGINIGLFAFIPIGQPDYLSEDIQYFFDIGLNYTLMFK